MPDFSRLDTVQGAILSLHVDEAAGLGSLTVEDAAGSFYSRTLSGAELAAVIELITKAVGRTASGAPIDVGAIAA